MQTHHPSQQDTQHERTCPFSPDPRHIDEKLVDHTGHIIAHRETPPHILRRTKVQHRDLGSLSLIASHTRTQFGYYKNDPACLLNFRFQFLGSTHFQRFERADVRIQFRGCQDQDSAPVVLDYGPKHLSSAGTDGQRNWWYNATLSATASSSMPLGPSMSAGAGGSHGRHSASTVEGADLSASGQAEPSIVKFWLREDEQQQDGVPFDFSCAIIAKYTNSFQTLVDVKVGPVFDWLATPWPPSNPIQIHRGVDYGEPIRAVPAIDFATLTAEEWRKLVTPELEFGQALHRDGN